MIPPLERKLRKSIIIRKLKGHICSLPDFLIIGAQKCGTSSLYHYLIKHPFIEPARGFIDSRKEVRFFSRHFSKGELFYRSHFPSYFHKAYFKLRYKKSLISGEASPSYIFFPLASKRVYDTLPNAKLIVLLRNPVDRAYSHYQHVVRLKKETSSFEEALDLEVERLHGEREKMLLEKEYISIDYMYHSYLTRGIYADQIEEWFKVFPREQFLFLHSETFFDDPSYIYNQALEFLDLPFWELEDFKEKNAAVYEKLNPHTRSRLVDFFRPHNQRLYDLIKQDFSWE